MPNGRKIRPCQGRLLHTHYTCFRLSAGAPTRHVAGRAVCNGLLEQQTSRMSTYDIQNVTALKAVIVMLSATAAPRPARLILPDHSSMRLHGEQISVHTGVDVTLVGGQNTEINCDHDSRAFELWGRLTLERITITSCKVSNANGGGVLIHPTGELRVLEQSAIKYCRAPRGGGIHMIGGRLEIDSSVISNCVADAVLQDSYSSAKLYDAVGGGIAADAGVINISASVIESCRATNPSRGLSQGGGLYLGSDPDEIAGSPLNAMLSHGTRIVDCAAEASIGVATGGGMLINGASGAHVTLMESHVLGCTAYASDGSTQGGAIAVLRSLEGELGTLQVLDSTIWNSTAQSDTYAASAGALYVGSGSGDIVLSHSRIEHCSAQSMITKCEGGSVYVHDGTVRLSNTTISSSYCSAGIDATYAYGAGGGIYMDGGAVSLIDSHLSSSTIYTRSINGLVTGGGVCITGGSLVLTRTTIAHCNLLQAENAAARGVYGGAIFVDESGTVRLSNSTVSDSSAEVGGGIALMSGHVYLEQTTITQCTAESLSANSSEGKGGALALFAPESGTAPTRLSLQQVSLWSNAAAFGAALWFQDSATDLDLLTGALISIRHVCSANASSVSGMETPSIIYSERLANVEQSLAEPLPYARLTGTTIELPNCNGSRAVAGLRLLPCGEKTAIKFFGDLSHSLDLPACALATVCRNEPLIVASSSGETPFDSPNLVSAFCTCQQGAIPKDGESVELAPYSKGCLVALKAVNLSSISYHVFEQVTKDSSDSYISIPITIRIEGTEWDESSYGWFVLNNHPAQWLTATNSTGVVEKPISGSDSVTTVGLIMNASGIGESLEALHSSLSIRIDLPMPQIVTIPVSMMVISEVSVEHCTLDDKSPYPLQATKNVPATFTFTARDIDGLEMARDTAHFTAAVSCSADCSHHEDRPTDAFVRYQGRGRYEVKLSLNKIGTYVVHVKLVRHPGVYLLLPFERNVSVGCPAAFFSKLPIGGSTCAPCPWEKTLCGLDRANVSGGVAIDTLELPFGFWRLSPFTTDIRNCTFAPGDPSPCVGGRGQIDKITNYCVTGLSGPMCRTCVQAGQYFDVDTARCKSCSASGSQPAYIVLLLLGILMGLALASFLMFALAWKFRLVRQVVLWTVRKWNVIGMNAKCKIIVGYYQVALSLPIVMDVPLPAFYQATLGLYDWITLEVLTRRLLAPECIGGFSIQLIMIATMPLIVIFFVVAIACALYVAHYKFVGSSIFVEASTSMSLAARRGFADAIPVVLFLIFCFLPSVSREAFLSFVCDGFGYNDANSSLTTSGFDGDHYFLKADYRVRCSWGSFVNTEYDNIRLLGFLIVLIWPVGVPLAFGGMLFAARSSIVHRRPTALFRATKFLHGEYHPKVFWWELYDTARKLLLTGFLLLIPQLLAFVRIIIAIIVSSAHLIILLSTKPFEDPWDSLAALAAAGSLIMTLFTMLLIKLFAVLSERQAMAFFGMNAHGSITLTNAIVSVNGLLLTIVMLQVFLQARAESRRPLLRRVKDSNVPTLTLDEKRAWHLFLSHNWDNQDVVAIIKRQLQLLMPGVRIFLDVDDLTSVEKLEEFVASSAAMLVLLGSRKYFTSSNCKREVAAAKEHQLPLILVHDDPSKKVNAPLTELREACPEALREFVFGAADRSNASSCSNQRSSEMGNSHRRDVVPWHRLHDFQVASLAKIAEQMLLASPAYCRKNALPLYIPGEVVFAASHFMAPIRIYTSKHNAKAAAIVAELKAHCGERVVHTPQPPATKEEREASPWLLVLDRDTFDGQNGVSLTAELSTWLSVDAGTAPHPVMAFTPPGAGENGCEFREIIDATPEHLKDAGLYGPLAIEWREGIHHKVSVRLLARMLGAQVDADGRMAWLWWHIELLLLRASTVCCCYCGRYFKGHTRPVRKAYSCCIAISRLWSRLWSRDRPSSALLTGEMKRRPTFRHIPPPAKMERASTAGGRLNILAARSRRYRHSIGSDAQVRVHVVGRERASSEWQGNHDQPGEARDGNSREPGRSCARSRASTEWQQPNFPYTAGRELMIAHHHEEL